PPRRLLALHEEVEDGPRRIEARLGLLLQERADDLGEERRHLGVAIREPLRRLLQLCCDDGGGAVALERVLATRELVEEDAQRVGVRRRTDSPASTLRGAAGPRRAVRGGAGGQELLGRSVEEASGE